MSYRTFADDLGQSWEVWDVRPDRLERREGERRRPRPTPWMGRERRVANDRRQHGEVRLRLSHLLAEGWLVFKSDQERRRLSPIPGSWDSLPTPELRELWERAEIIGTRIREEPA